MCVPIVLYAFNQSFASLCIYTVRGLFRYSFLSISIPLNSPLYLQTLIYIGVGIFVCLYIYTFVLSYFCIFNTAVPFVLTWVTWVFRVRTNIYKYTFTNLSMY